MGSINQNIEGQLIVRTTLKRIDKGYLQLIINNLLRSGKNKKGPLDLNNEINPDTFVIARVVDKNTNLVEFTVPVYSEGNSTYSEEWETYPEEYGYSAIKCYDWEPDDEHDDGWVENISDLVYEFNEMSCLNKMEKKTTSDYTILPSAISVTYYLDSDCSEDDDKIEKFYEDGFFHLSSIGHIKLVNDMDLGFVLASKRLLRREIIKGGGTKLNLYKSGKYFQRPYAGYLSGSRNLPLLFEARYPEYEDTNAYEALFVGYAFACMSEPEKQAIISNVLGKSRKYLPEEVIAYTKQNFSKDIPA